MFKAVCMMDLKRCMVEKRFVVIVLCSAFLLAASVAEYVIPYLMKSSQEERNAMTGAIDFLHYAMGFDVFKVIIALLFCGLYTGSFCRDKNSKYLRMILSRTDMITYVRARFLINTIAVVTASVLSCFIFAGGMMILGFPLVSEDAKGGLLGAAFYRKVVERYPIVYLGMIGLQFGMIIAAFSSIGLLFSSWQSNTFVSIGLGGLSFFLMLSISVTLINGTPFDVLNLISMNSVFPAGYESNPWTVFAWGMMYPLTIIVICCMRFERRMKWRIEYGAV